MIFIRLPSRRASPVRGKPLALAVASSTRPPDEFLKGKPYAATPVETRDGVPIGNLPAEGGGAEIGEGRERRVRPSQSEIDRVGMRVDGCLCHLLPLTSPFCTSRWS